MTDRSPERFDALSADECSPAIVERAAGHDRHSATAGVKEILDGEQTSFQVQRVDRRFGQQNVDASSHQRVDLGAITVDHLLESRISMGGIVFRADGQLLGGRADRAGDEPRLVGRPLGPLVGRFAGTGDGGAVDLVDQLQRQIEFDHADRRGTKRIRLDNVAAGLEVGPMDVRDFLGVGQAQNVGKILQILVVIGESLTPHRSLVQLQSLDHRPHCPVEQQNSLADKFVQ